MKSAVLTLFSLLSVAAATPASKLFARHNECEYSGISGGVRFQGTCKTDGGAGVCTLNGLSGTWGCDYKWHNNAGMTACGNAADSQYAVGGAFLPIRVLLLTGMFSANQMAPLAGLTPTRRTLEVSWFTARTNDALPSATLEMDP
ncbi:hypothetical protein JX266_008310 [Neoarthrinium moseri]|uniref:uncharacterized protein n=1 Tax=Neoarthrinium moseri TaxID=1658444 RepID=UPI001FDC1945|nr:uncharacterized protein JN550_009924 [Neoarthrinium moseri]KAI1845452.1 hypothetical protein JX266_008310 [Neoarthrinium moseri]KAI1862777.1 hypothetical protein JN550_009924 [Neoarthrinium moseri]